MKRYLCSSPYQQSGKRRRAGTLRCVGFVYLLTLSALFAASAEALAQAATGRIVGRVVSTQTGEGLPAVQVQVPEFSIGTLTDANGRYVLTRLPPGVHSVVAHSLGYGRKTVTGIEVREDEATALDISLDPQAVALEVVTVTAERERGSTGALLSERRRSAVVVDAIGQEQIGRTPDSDAAEALKRVPGVTVVDGQFVYVRGLGERYGQTTLNGAPMPSPIPDKKAVPLDVIPANLLESVVTAKTYSPDQRGDYAGGLVQIETRSVPTSRALRLSTSVGYNTAASLEPAMNTDGGGLLDLFGFDDGARDLPIDLRGGNITLPTEPAAREEFADAVTRRFGLAEDDASLNRSYSIAYGDEWAVGGRPVGIIGTFSLSNSFDAPQNNAERVFNLDLGGAPALDVGFDVDAGQEETALGSLVSVSFEVAPAQRITAVGTYNRLTEDQSRVFSGPYENVSPFVRSFQTRYLANSIANLQLRGEHLLSGLGQPIAEWRASYGRAERDEPGTRITAYGGGAADADLFFISTASSGLIFAQELEEDLGSAAVDFKLPLTFRSLPASLSLGGSGDLRDRGVFTRRIFLDPVGGIPGEVARLLPGELFVAERIGTDPGDFRPRDRTFPEDNFDATEAILGGYAMFDAEVLPKLRMVAGARVEYARQEVDIRGRNTATEQITLDDTDVLPALNLTYALTPEVNLRGAVSCTVARPEFRERTPFLYEDFFGGLPTRGNPFLERAGIVNYDVRAEWFGPNGMLLSASGFFKDFTDPIEPVFLFFGTNRGQSFANSEGARVYGTELELRTTLGFLSPVLDALTFNGNLTLAESEVRGDSVILRDPGLDMPDAVPVSRNGDSALFGQSPYVVNTGLSYFHSASGTTATVLFNRFGRRLDARGLLGVPDVYEEARGQLDFVLEQPLRAGLALRFAAERLVGGEVEFTQSFPNGDVVSTRHYDIGTTFSVSASWEP